MNGRRTRRCGSKCILQQSQWEQTVPAEYHQATVSWQSIGYSDTSFTASPVSYDSQIFNLSIRLIGFENNEASRKTCSGWREFDRCILRSLGTGHLSGKACCAERRVTVWDFSDGTRRVVAGSTRQCTWRMAMSICKKRIVKPYIITHPIVNPNRSTEEKEQYFFYQLLKLFKPWRDKPGHLFSWTILCRGFHRTFGAAASNGRHDRKNRHWRRLTTQSSKQQFTRTVQAVMWKWPCRMSLRQQ